MNNVIYACNDGYAKLAGISLISLLKNNPSIGIRCFFILDNVSQKNIDKLKEIKSTYSNLVEIVFVDAASIVENISKYVTGYVNSIDVNMGGGYTSYTRLFFEGFIPETEERIVYIDCDTLVVGDIEALFLMDMKGKPIAMSYDCTNVKYKKVLHLAKTDRYYNAGILVIDTKEWKKRKCFQRLFDEVKKGVSYIFVDQDFINICLRDEITKFSFRFNYCSSFYMFSSVKSISFVFGLNDFNSEMEDFNEAKNNPCILHFNGNMLTRPWYHNSQHPIKSIYDTFYFESPWKDEPQTDYKIPMYYKVHYFLYKYTPKIFFYISARVLQDVFYLLKY